MRDPSWVADFETFMDAHGLSTHALSQRSGLSERHLGDLLVGRVSKPRPATVRGLTSALDVPIERLVGDTPGQLLFGALLPVDLADTVYNLARHPSIGRRAF